MPSLISKDVSTSDQDRDVIADLILSACDESDAQEVIDVLIRDRWEREPAPYLRESEVR